MSETIAESDSPRMRIGAVGYLNSQPLIEALDRLVPEAEIIVDLPSLLADALVDRRLDVALIPSIEYFRHPEMQIVSDACVACDGPVKSVKLFGRVPIERVRTLALDEGSRTSAAITRILLKEEFGLEPKLEQFPIGATLDDSVADAIMLIGDRAMRPVEGDFDFIRDIGEWWCRRTGLPCVFAMWVAQPDADLQALNRPLTMARDVGISRFEQIARTESRVLGIPEEECLSYLRDHLRFHLGPRERQGLDTFVQRAVKYGLISRDEGRGARG